MTLLEKWDRRFLALAEHVATWSKDESTQVGAVIVDREKRVVSLGYNGLARGVADTKARLTHRETKYKIIVHAERNALLFARQDLTGCTLYTTPFMPCAGCAAMILQSGIREVVSYPSENPRWQEDFALTTEMLHEAGVALRLFSR